MVLHVLLSLGPGSDGHVHQPDTQVVAHIQQAANNRRMATKLSHHSTPSASQGPPRSAARDLLLHHDRLAQLPSGVDRVLE